MGGGSTSWAIAHLQSYFQKEKAMLRWHKLVTFKRTYVFHDIYFKINKITEFTLQEGIKIISIFFHSGLEGRRGGVKGIFLYASIWLIKFCKWFWNRYEIMRRPKWSANWETSIKTNIRFKLATVCIPYSMHEHTMKTSMCFICFGTHVKVPEACLLYNS